MIAERFRVERRLGRGGMATVYLAYDEDLDRRVAVKVLESLAGDGDGRRRFLREARLAAGLAHPNVVTVFDSGEHDGAPYIVMEYVEGGNLGELIARRGRLPAGEVVALGRQACAGLQHAHESGLVHRDVKPQNLLVRADGTLKVTDFGIAFSTEATRMTTDGTILGTAAYLAPEQVNGEEVGGAVDVYGLGAVLYEALTGRPPIEVRSLAELADAKGRRPQPLRNSAPDVPRALESAVMWALERRPDARPGSPAELADALELEAAEAPTIRLRPSRTPRMPRTRRPAAAVVLALVLAAVGIALALALARPDSAPAPVDPVPQRAGAAEQARALADWLRENSRG
jgi:eukaryotic-like serine/threonine-protein kinase